MHTQVNNTYEHALANAFHKIDMRGLLMDVPRLKTFGGELQVEIDDHCKEIAKKWGCHVFVGRANDDGSDTCVNLNATKGKKALLTKLQQLGYKVPKVKKKNELKEIEYKESTNELALRRMFGETGDDALRRILRIRELEKMLTTYVEARLYSGVFLSNYGVASTLTGRRGSKKHIFNFGGNAQNFPKHGQLAPKFRRCIISRPGKIFFSVDQIQAEDWPVNALANNSTALADMKAGVDRHTKLASWIFQKPEDAIAKDSIERYLGKKARHANNYGMQPPRMCDALAQEGFSVPIAVCKDILAKVNQFDPSVDEVFHAYVKRTVGETRLLTTPLGRERYFMGFRPNDANYELWGEAYSYVPQSTVADNTGLAILVIEEHNNYIVQDGHDSIIQEVPETESDILSAYRAAVQGFTRELRFYNGISIQIPIEGEIGYDLASLVKVKDFTEDGVLDAWRRAKLKREEQLASEAQATVATGIS